MAHVTVSVHRRVPRRLRRWRLIAGGSTFAQLLRRLVGRGVHLGKVLGRRRRSEASRAGHDVEQPPDVLHRSLFIVLLCFASKRSACDARIRAEGDQVSRGRREGGRNGTVYGALNIRTFRYCEHTRLESRNVDGVF